MPVGIVVADFEEGLIEEAENNIATVAQRGPIDVITVEDFSAGLREHLLF